MSSLSPGVIRAAPVPGPLRRLVRRAGAGAQMLAELLGGTALLSFATLREAVTRPFGARELVRQMYFVGVKSIPIVTVTSLFVGMVLALQFAYGLERFGAKLYVAKLVGLALVREMGPVLTSLLVGGKVGAGIAAELGSMNVTEQVDAIRALGASEIKKLVVPRVIAATLTMPLLAIYADVVGVFGGLLVCVGDVGMKAGYYFSSMGASVMVHDVLHGAAKTIFFGFIIGIIGCYEGLRTRGGTEGVGIAATRSVVTISIAILVGDFLLTRLFGLL